MKTPSKRFYLQHLNKFSQYSQSKSWISWYSDVAKHKAIRTVKILKEYKGSDAKLLDLGCGIGLSFSILAQEFPNCVGCDSEEKAVIATKVILKTLNLKVPVVNYDGERLPFSNNTFDIVTCIEVIEHAKDPDLLLKEIERVLKPDGFLHITTANKWWPYEPHFKLLFLSYLPEKLANLYVRLSGKGEGYDGIKLPSYNGFKKMVDKYFITKDITLEIIRNYKQYSFDKERGFKVVIVSKLLNFSHQMDSVSFLEYLPISMDWILLRISLGWLFIAKPKK